MQRIKQIYYPEGYFEKLRVDNMSKDDIDSIVGTSAIVSGKVLAYIANMNDKDYLQVDMGSGKIGKIYVDGNIYKNKSLVNEMINFCVCQKLGDNEYLLERDSLVERAKNGILQKYKVGDLITCKVVSFLGYGAIVDIGWGTIALLHKSCIPGNPDNPKLVLKNISFLEVEITNISEDGNIYVKMIENG